VVLLLDVDFAFWGGGIRIRGRRDISVPHHIRFPLTLLQSSASNR